MRTSLELAALALAIAITQSSGAAWAQSPPPPAQPPELQGPAKIEGHVVKIDPERSRVMVRDDDGHTREFEASPETLKDLKVGDRIEAKRRPAK